VNWRSLSRAALTALLIGSAGLFVTGSAQDSGTTIVARLQYARAGGIYDPAYWRYTSDWFVYPNVFNWLVRWVPGSAGRELEPDLAESWEVSEDGRTYTFHLRQGVQFHGGYGELTADDVVFSLQRQMDDPEASFASDLANVTELTAVDDHTVRLTLAEPDASFLATVIAYRPGLIVSRTAVEERGEAFATQPIGTGPFEFVELTEAGDVVLTAFDDYFRGRPEVDTLIFRHIGEESVALQALRADEFQIIQTRGNPEVAAALAEDPEIETSRTVMTDSVRHIAFSPNFEPTQDVLVRQALAHAIDKELIDQALVGMELPTDVVYADDAIDGAPTYPYDPERARELLAEAGYPDGFPVTIMFQNRVPESILAEIVAACWQDVGLQVTLEGMEATAAFDRRNSFDFDVTVTSVGRPGDPNLLFTDLFHSSSEPPGGSNYFGYDGVDDLIEQARGVSDAATRAELYHQAHAQIMADLPIIPLSLQTFVGAWRDPVESLVFGANNNFWGETIRLTGGDE
jgi:peptide/nickel transport system substrate-binding protein